MTTSTTTRAPETLRGTVECWVECGMAVTITHGRDYDVYSIRERRWWCPWARGDLLETGVLRRDGTIETVVDGEVRRWR